MGLVEGILLVRIFLQGLLPVFPIITKQLGVNKFQTGLLMALLFSAMCIGTIIIGKLSTIGWNVKRLIFIVTIPLSLSLFSIGFASNYFEMLLSAIILGFSCGAYIIGHFILLGRHSDSMSASNNFSFISFTNLLATVIGSFIMGFCIKQFGIKISFTLFSLILFFNTFSILLLREVDSTINKRIIAKFIFQKRYIWLLIASLLSIMCIYIFSFTLALSLSEHNYPIYQIAYYTSIGTVIMSWFPLLLGRITNQKSSKKSFIVCLLGVLIAFGILLFGSHAYLYILAIAFMTLMTYPFFIPVMQKIFTWYKRDQLPMAQSYYTATAWVAATIGYLLTGTILQYSGFYFAIITGFGVAILALTIIVIKIE